MILRYTAWQAPFFLPSAPIPCPIPYFSSPTCEKRAEEGGVGETRRGRKYVCVCVRVSMCVRVNVRACRCLR